VHERRGALEIAIVRGQDSDDEDGRHLIWRVRLIALSDDEILVEQPMTLGQVIHLEPGIELAAILALGQNRWMFTTSMLGLTPQGGGDRRATTAMRLVMPKSVNLPEVEVWPLLDPKSVIVAERANELQFEADQSGSPGDAADEGASTDATMPEVGPKFTASLLNLGGGGLGLRVRPQDAPALGRHKLFWLRFSLPPGLTTPICATGKLAHTNVDSTQHTYAGMAFDFSFNPGHQRLVVAQVCRYITAIQRLAQADAA
jgi:hypothetical protein